MPGPLSSTSSSTSSSDSWRPGGTVIAGGFAVPGQGSPWLYRPRRLSISEDIDGSYLLHTEIGVWKLPSLFGAPHISLQPSKRHTCIVVET
ncbi:hypothetical protein MY10362_006575 [Beauveria mimosiformis]